MQDYYFLQEIETDTERSMKLIKDAKFWIRKYKNIKKFYNGGGNLVEFDGCDAGHLKISIDGKDNVVRIKNCSFSRYAMVRVHICGSHNTVLIDGLRLSGTLEISMGQNHEYFGPITGSKVVISPGTSIEEMKYLTYNSNTEFTVDEDCMISYGVTVYNTDAHAILTYPEKKLANPVRGVHIGRHCWIGMHVTVMKNTSVPEDSIVGACSVISGRFEEKHAVYAGNPAVLVKKNRNWDSNGKKYGYIENRND